MISIYNRFDYNLNLNAWFNYLPIQTQMADSWVPARDVYTDSLQCLVTVSVCM